MRFELNAALELADGFLPMTQTLKAHPIRDEKSRIGALLDEYLVKCNCLGEFPARMKGPGLAI